MPHIRIRMPSISFISELFNFDCWGKISSEKCHFTKVSRREHRREQQKEERLFLNHFCYFDEACINFKYFLIQTPVTFCRPDSQPEDIFCGKIFNLLFHFVSSVFNYTAFAAKSLLLNFTRFIKLSSFHGI